MSEKTSEEYNHMGQVLLALNKIEEDQLEVLGEVVGGTEEGIFECIQHFTDEDFETAELIGRNIELQIEERED
jgi:hypothetical protein